MTRDINRLVRQATTQQGLLSLAQLRDLGYSRRNQESLIRHGTLVTVRPGVVRLVGSPPSWEQQVLAPILTPGAALVASHRCALRIWGLFTRFDGVEFTVAHPARRRMRGAVVHRSVDISAADITEVEGIPVTTVARTLCDAGLIFSAKMVQHFVDHAVATEMVTTNELMAVRQRVGEHGRNGVVSLEQAVDHVGPSTSGAQSGPELALYRVVTGAGIPAPQRQHPVTAGSSTYFVDLAYPHHQVALEYDGVDAHTRLDQFTNDRRRQNALIAAGWLVLRFTHSDVRDRPEAVAAEVRRVLHARSASPTRFSGTSDRA